MSSDTAETVTAYTLHRTSTHDERTAAVRYVLQRARDVEDARHLLEVLGLTETAWEMRRRA